MAKHATSKQTQIFSLTAPTAKSVQLVGEFTHWKSHPINMRKRRDGVWQATIELEPGTHYYRFLVDGEWRDDPSCLMRAPNPFGTQDSVRQV